MVDIAFEWANVIDPNHILQPLDSLRTTQGEPTWPHQHLEN